MSVGPDQRKRRFHFEKILTYFENKIKILNFRNTLWWRSVFYKCFSSSMFGNISYQMLKPIRSETCMHQTKPILLDVSHLKTEKEKNFQNRILSNQVLVILTGGLQFILTMPPDLIECLCISLCYHQLV